MTLLLTKDHRLRHWPLYGPLAQGQGWPLAARAEPRQPLLKEPKEQTVVCQVCRSQDLLSALPVTNLQESGELVTPRRKKWSVLMLEPSIK